MSMVDLYDENGRSSDEMHHNVLWQLCLEVSLHILGSFLQISNAQ